VKKDREFLLVSIHGCGLISIIVAAILTPLPDESGKMTLDEYEKLPPEGKDHFGKWRNVERYLIGEACVKCCFNRP
jgi:hypothetical protein